MSQHDDIDDARAALIDQRIGQAFDFLADVIEDARLLDVVPDGSRLAFRDVAIGEFRFRLAAYQAPDAGDGWSALVTGCHSASSEDGPKAHLPAATSLPRATEPVAFATGKTAVLALDALEAELRTLVTIPA